MTSTFVRRQVWRRFAPVAVGTVLGCTSSGSPRTDTPTTSPNPPAERQLVWADEFDGPAGSRVDNSTWRYDLGDGCQAGNCGWGNNEKEYYTSDAENIVLNGQGQLAITARPAPAGLTCYYGACRYTSAKITTRGNALVPPGGRLEARIKLPSGQGLWPAFWMLGNNFPTTPWPQCGEIDVMENHGSDVTSISSAMHGPGYSGNTPFVRSYQLAATSFSDDFHTFAAEWNTNGIQLSVDGKVYHVVLRDDVQRRGNWVFDQSFFVILNLAVGGTFDGDPKSDAILPATMLVDYVRAYR